MLIAENSDFGVTGELLAETLVVDGTGNVNESYQLIQLKDQWMLVWKRSKHGTLVLYQYCFVTVEALQTAL